LNQHHLVTLCVIVFDCSDGGAGNSKQHKTKSGQLNMMARDFTMQNYAVIKNGSSTKVLNLPPKPSRNAKNNTLVLGSS